MAVIIYVSESATPTVRGKITAKTHPPCPLAAARGCVMPADPAGHGGCRLCRLAGHRIGQYAHLQQCARMVIPALILGRRERLAVANARYSLSVMTFLSVRLAPCSP